MSGIPRPGALPSANAQALQSGQPAARGTSLEATPDRELAVYAPHVVILAEWAALNDSFRIGVNPIPPLRSLMADAEAYADESDPYWTELDRADSVVDEHMERYGAIDPFSYAALYKGIVVRLMRRAGLLDDRRALNRAGSKATYGRIQRGPPATPVPDASAGSLDGGASP